MAKRTGEMQAVTDLSEEELAYKIFRDKVLQALNQGKLDSSMFRATIKTNLELENPDPDLLRILRRAEEDETFPPNLRTIISLAFSPHKEAIDRWITSGHSESRRIQKLVEKGSRDKKL